MQANECLKKILMSKRIPARWLAAACGVTAARLWQIAAGAGRPSLELATRLHAITGIEATAWHGR